MNTFKAILISTFLFSYANASAENKFQVLDRGLDGDQRQYMVTCTDGRTSSVTKYFELPEVNVDREKLLEKLMRGESTIKKSSSAKLIKVCIELESGNEECRPSWDMDIAAKASCS